MKVVDMGCATGEITAFIADQVGREGRVEGVDPDQERIKVAVKKMTDDQISANISFRVGDSSSRFKEEFYDIHFSNFVFHWLNGEEKYIFLQTAYKCLKPGGLIAILTNEKIPQIMKEVSELLSDDETMKDRPPLHYVEKSVTESLLETSGFHILSSEYIETDDTFPSLDYFITWCCAAIYIDESKILQHKKEAFAKKFVNGDETIRLVHSALYMIIARKEVLIERK